MLDYKIGFKTRYVALAAYTLILLPVLLFMLCWLKLYIGIPAALLVVAGCIWIYRTDFIKDDSGIKISLFHFCCIVCLFGIVVAISGIAGVGVSGYDIPWRNAIFHDLIDFEWPIIYENGNAMVYYCVFWLPAALVGKLLGWGGGLVALGVFVTAIITVSYLLILCLLHIESNKRIWLAGSFMVLWSGLHFLAAALITTWVWNLYDYPLLTEGGGYMDSMFNGESFNFYYRSNIITLMMTYNQLVIWLAVPLALIKRKAHSFLFLGLLIMPYSPWGFIGLIPLLIVIALPDLAKSARNGKTAAVLKSLFSPANIIALFVILPVFALYFLASTKTGGGSDPMYASPDQVADRIAAGMAYTTQSGSFGFLSLDRFSIYNFAGLVGFWLMEFGIFMFLIAPKYRKTPLFWTVLVVLMIAPVIWAGTVSGRDFCMNASLPGIFLLMILVLRYMNEEVCGKILNARNFILVAVVVIAFIGPTFALLGNVHTMRQQGSISVVNDSIKTLSDKPVENYSNFLIDNPQDKPFYKYLAR